MSTTVLAAAEEKQSRSGKMLVLRLSAMIAGGLLFCAAFPPLGLWFLMCPSMVLLLFAVRDIHPRYAFYIGFGYGMIAYSASLWWMWNIFAAGALSLWALLAFFTALFATLLGVAENSLKHPLLKTVAITKRTAFTI